MAVRSSQLCPACTLFPCSILRVHAVCYPELPCTYTARLAPPVIKQASKPPPHTAIIAIIVVCSCVALRPLPLPNTLVRLFSLVLPLDGWPARGLPPRGDHVQSHNHLPAPRYGSRYSPARLVMTQVPSNLFSLTRVLGSGRGLGATCRRRAYHDNGNYGRMWRRLACLHRYRRSQASCYVHASSG